MEERIINSHNANIYTNSEGQGYPIVFCDGLGCNGYAFKHLRLLLSKHYQTIYFNYQGHGKSIAFKQPDNYTMATIQRDLLAVLDGWDIKEAILLGYSMGAQVAFDLALKYPAKVRALISIAGSYGRPLDFLHNTNLTAKALPAVQVLLDTLPDSVIQWWWDTFIGAKITQDALALSEVGLNQSIIAELDPYFQHLAKMEPKAFLYTLASSQQRSLECRLSRITQPTLIIAGERDTMNPLSVSQTIHAKIPHSELSVVFRGSHVVMLESPEFVGMRVEQFLKERVC